jgi:hypothetical protein|tara:strand:- start:546 stop:830 length:285 start_codon:yes stop_codon:yes gene_type:complete
MLKEEIIIPISRYSTRMPYKTDASGNSVEGGALNANYTAVEAVGVVCNLLGKRGFTYGKDFIFEDTTFTEKEMDDAICIRFNDKKLVTALGLSR